MTKYVAFLRGINVGGRIIKMTELKSCFETLGFHSVITVLQTGNVIFETNNDLSNLKMTIENGLSQQFHYQIYVQVYGLDKLKGVVANSPFTANDNHHIYVVFFENGLAKQILDEAIELDDNVDKVKPGDGVIYWRVPIGQTLTSSFAKYLTKAKYKNFNTNRNIKTLAKIIQ